jgi:hypothetical protein
MKYFILFITLLVILEQRADADTPTVNIAAHFGIAYAAEAITYGAWSNAFGMPQGTALLFASMTTAIGCLGYAALSRSTDSLALPMDGVGMATFALSAYFFNWKFENIPFIEGENHENAVR